MKKPTPLIAGAAAVTAAAALGITGAALANASQSERIDRPVAQSAYAAPRQGPFATGYDNSPDQGIQQDGRSPGGRHGQAGPTGQRSDETPLTGESLTKATAAAKAKEPSATVLRAETDGDGQGKYEVHMTRSDGTRITVFLDDSYAVTSVEAGQGQSGNEMGSGRGHGMGPGMGTDEDTLQDGYLQRGPQGTGAQQNSQ